MRLPGRVCVALLVMAATLVAAPTFAQKNPDTVEFFRRAFGTEEFEPKTFGPAKWLENGAAYTTVEPSSVVAGAKDIVRYGTPDGQRSVLVSASQLVPPGAKTPLKIDNYSWSRDMSKLLIYTNSQPVWRQRTRGDYWVLDRKGGTLRKLGGDAAESTLMFAKFSPDGTKVAYVRANNLYVEDLAGGKIVALTSDGSEFIVNGTSDWVYEEELDLRDGFRWSPDGKQIAYWQFDKRGVGIFPLLYNLGAPDEIVTGFPYPGVGPYPTHKDIPYPIAGTTNSAARAGVVNVAGGETRWFAVPGDPRENYIARMEWIPGTQQVVMQHLNRLQNTNDVLAGDAATGAVKTAFREHDDAWLDVVDEFTWLGGSGEFLWQSERSGWRHLYRASKDGQVKAITHGDFDAIRSDGIDAKGSYVYFIASPENAGQRYLYRARLDGSGEAERLTPRDAAGTHSYEISPDGRWAFHTFSNASTPPKTDLVELPSHRVVRVLADNDPLRAATAPFLAKAPVEFFKVDIGEGSSMDAWMLKPADFDPSKKYPVLVYVYGEPAGQTVLDHWDGSNGFFDRAVTAEGYIVVSMDNRGTPAPKGRTWRKMVYGAIHPVIVKDQTAGLQALLRSRPYMDASRVAVWGWSGGGSSTLNLMFRSPDVYKVGMAVAPVPDLRLYDSIYQERYMGLPQQNAEGYRNSSAINFADGLRGKLLIVHGSGDDNVHYAGTELLLNRLIELGKPFDFMEYPNRTHAISQGKGTTLHLYSLLMRYLEEHVEGGAK